MNDSCDVVVAGGGPAGLACAVELRRLRPDWQVWLLEKGKRIGAHLLSGAVLEETPATRRFFADASVLPGAARVERDRFAALTERGTWPLPWAPPPMRQRGRICVPLSSLAAAMESLAVGTGVEIFCAQPAFRLLWDGPRVAGVVTGTPERPEEIPAARAVVLAEGPAGVLAREARERLPRLRPASPQRWSLGLKHVYRVPGNGAGEGRASTLHTFGHPLPARQFGGGFLYGTPGRIDAGFVAALEPEPLPVSPREAFRAFLAHPAIARRLRGAEPVAYGARLLPERGWHALPDVLSDGGAWLVGDAAGLLDPFTLKGIHLAIESGVAAAHSIAEGRPLAPADLPSAAALRRSRAYRDGFAGGLLPGIFTAGLVWATRGLLPPSRRPKPVPPDPAPSAPVPPGPDPSLDADLALARLDGPQLAGPSHIAVRDPALCRECPAPCLRFCPAAVYAPSPVPGGPPVIRHENCIHCRTCLVACPRGNILWTPPALGPDFAENV